MNVTEMDVATKNRLAQAYTAEGLVVLSGVVLPTAFTLRAVDVVFLRQGDSCEIHVDSGIGYRGQTPVWREVQASPDGPGGSKFVTAVRGDFVTGLVKLGELLRAEAESPAPEGEHAELRRPAPRARGGFRDLVDEQRRSKRRFVGRQEALLALKTNLVRESKPGVVLVAPAGVGKTTLVEMLAADIAHGRDVPATLRDAAIYDVPLGSLVEDSRMVGDVERNARRVFEQQGNAVFFLDEIHQLARPELAPLRDLLKPAMAEGRVRVIGATTPVEWRRVEDLAFKRRFLEMRLEPPTLREAAEMLRERKVQIARHHALDIDDLSVHEAVLLADRYLPLRNFPDKAVDVLDQACAMQVMAAVDAAGSTKGLERPFLVKAVAAQSGVSEDLVDPRRAAVTVASIADRLRSRLHGQDEALRELGRVLEANLAMRNLGWDSAVRDLRRTTDGRPLASFLLCGPTGVGKSETAKLLARELFGGHLIVLNGNDVGREAAHGTSMWTGSPPGYVGSQSGGVLTNGLRATPNAVILIDELEKASPEAVQNVVLGLLDGKVNDRNDGTVLSTAETVVVATTNIVAKSGGYGAIGFGVDGDLGDGDRGPEAALTGRLWPEVIGRFGAVLSFQELRVEAQWRIWEELQREQEVRLGHGVVICLDDRARECVQDRFRRNRGGARGVVRFFRNQVLPLLVACRAGRAVLVTVVDGRLASSGWSPRLVGSESLPTASS